MQVQPGIIGLIYEPVRKLAAPEMVHFLSSLAGLMLPLVAKPSHKWLGYFQIGTCHLPRMGFSMRHASSGAENSTFSIVPDGTYAPFGRKNPAINGWAIIKVCQSLEFKFSKNTVQILDAIFFELNCYKRCASISLPPQSPRVT